MIVTMNNTIEGAQNRAEDIRQSRDAIAVGSSLSNRKENGNPPLYRHLAKR